MQLIKKYNFKNILKSLAICYVCVCVCVCVCPALTTRQCQGREGVVEIVAWNYDAHTPNFPSLSEARASGYAGSFPPFHPRRASARVSPSAHPYLA